LELTGFANSTIFLFLFVDGQQILGVLNLVIALRIGKVANSILISSQSYQQISPLNEPSLENNINFHKSS